MRFQLRRTRAKRRMAAVRAGAWLGLAAAALVAACESSDPETTPLPGAGGGGAGGAGYSCAPDAQIESVDDASCMPLDGDYQPGSADDGWDACISDDDSYHPIDASISSIARVGAFEEISSLLGFGENTAPSAQAFLDARVAYTTDEGLESRVARREDEHYPAAPSACNEMSAADLADYRERCVGPAQIQPLLNEAFQQGIDGIDPTVNAARIEAGLLWFLYVSSYKEAMTCTTTPKDCDSSYAYYTGGEPRSGGLGLARYTQARSEQAHDRVWDGILAVRCWRDLDHPTGEATNLELRDAAIGQLDRALLRSVAIIVRQRALELPCDAAWETVRILGPVLDREATERDATEAATLRAQVGRADQLDVDADALVGALDALFPCP